MYQFTSDWLGLHCEKLLVQNSTVISVYAYRPACSAVPLEHAKLHSSDQDSQEAWCVLGAVCRLQPLCANDFIHVSALQIRCLVSS